MSNVLKFSPKKFQHLSNDGVESKGDLNIANRIIQQLLADADAPPTATIHQLDFKLDQKPRLKILCILKKLPCSNSEIAILSIKHFIKLYL